MLIEPPLLWINFCKYICTINTPHPQPPATGAGLAFPLPRGIGFAKSGCLLRLLHPGKAPGFAMTLSERRLNHSGKAPWFAMTLMGEKPIIFTEKA
jgi:hypothetical protein